MGIFLKNENVYFQIFINLKEDIFTVLEKEILEMVFTTGGDRYESKSQNDPTTQTETTQTSTVE